MSLKRIETAAKIAGIIAALFAIAKYFIDQYTDEVSMRSERSLALISEFHSGDVRSATKYYNSWVINALRRQPTSVVSESSLGRAIYGSLLFPQQDELRESIELLRSFFVRVEFCVDKDLCDRDMVIDHFCGVRRSLVAPFKAVDEYYEMFQLQISGDQHIRVWASCIKG